MSSTSPFANRITKRHKHLRKWAQRWPTNAWRLYDRDIPEYPWTVDLYDDHIFLQEFPDRRATDDERMLQRAEVRSALKDLLDHAPDHLHERTRQRQRGGMQYSKQAATGIERVVTEGPLSFLVNLHDYIDTGLFLDHRALRREVAQRAASFGPRARLLNLFCYTGTFSVWSAHQAGAHTTNVDLSGTYLEWAQRNMARNGLPPQHHIFQRADILQWLPREIALGRRYEIIVLDPPTFSRSERMERDLDVQRDHIELIERCMDLLAPDGVLFFSTNSRRFELDGETLAEFTSFKEITDRSIPQDFRPGIHRAFEITHP